MPGAKTCTVRRDKTTCISSLYINAWPRKEPPGTH